jgi:pyruvate/2-oxoglutarate dehydrogenase complex dihydrolipoamide dehydrogenase (E3) component
MSPAAPHYRCLQRLAAACYLGTYGHAAPGRWPPRAARAPAMAYDFDTLVLGGGPTGDAAVSACALLTHSRTAVVDTRGSVSAAPTGVISKAYRAAALALPASADWSEVRGWVTATVERASTLPSMADFASPGGSSSPAEVIKGTARLVDEHTVAVVESGATRIVTSDAILIATGSKSARFGWIPFAKPGVYDSDNIRDLGHRPRCAIVLGASVVGCEYAFIFRTYHPCTSQRGNHCTFHLSVSHAS